MHRQSKKILVIVIVVTLLMVTFIAQGLHTLRTIENMNTDWKQQADFATEITDTLSRIRGSSGYTGFIHNFKNYVIRRDNVYIDRALENAAQTKEALDELEVIVEDRIAISSIRVVRDTVDLYIDNLTAAYELDPDLEVRELDVLVRVNDAPAALALTQLDEFNKKLLTAQEVLNQRNVAEMASLTRYGMVYVIVFVLFGGIIVLMVIQQDKTVRQITAITQENDALFDVAPNVTLVLDETGTVVRANALATRMFGYSDTALIGKPVTDLLPDYIVDDTVVPFPENVGQTASTLRESDTEHFARSRTGKEIPVIVYESHILRRTMPLTILAVYDLSERNAALAEIDNARSAETAAVAANSAKSAFLATMSHELRTPLNAVIGFSEALLHTTRENHNPDTTLKYASLITESGQHLLKLINEVLDFEKIASGKFQLSEMPFSLSEEISNLHSAFEVRAHQALVDFQVIVPTQHYILYGDALRFRQVLMNLIDNAIKFSNGGEVKATFQTEPYGVKQIRVIARISDTGVGIPEEKIETVFTPFLQSDPSVTRKFGGTGLGLSISRTLSQMLGGDVTVESKYGIGSTFTAEFIFGDHTDAIQSITVSERPRQQQEDKSFEFTILTVDDVETNLDVIETIAEDLGCTVQKARNGQEAVDFVANNDVDLVLMDIHMPVLDGITAAQKIRKLPGRKSGVPIFAWTADISCGNALADSGINWEGAIFKPTSRSEVINVLSNLGTD